ncbi:MAG: 50S ribosomal protein L32 [Parcubacteria group bacterium]|nr:50S ribosomal protein L32 [Parcubacteria group bacterium]
MGVPRGRRTKSKQRHRRSHLALKVLSLAGCAKCGAKKMPHTVCSACGFYKGRLVVDVMAKLSKKERKEKEKKSAAK